MKTTIQKALGNNGLENTNVYPELFEAFTVSECVLTNDKVFVYVRPANQLAYNELSDQPVQAGAVRCEVGGFYSQNESRTIKKGSRVLVIKPHPSADIGYVLQILGSAIPVETTKKDLVSPNSFSFKGENAGFHVDGTRNHISLYTSNNNEILLTDSEASITLGNSQLKINTKAFKMDNGLSSLDIQNNISLLAGGDIIIGAGSYSISNSRKEIKMFGSGLSIDVSGGTIETTSKNTKSTQLIKHDEVGAKYSINIGSSLINPNIGIRDTTSYDLNVLQGDISMHTTVGGVFIHASNMLQKDSIKLVTGLAIRKIGVMQGIPPYASIDVGGIKGIRMETIGVGADSLVIGPMNITALTTGKMGLTSALATSITSGATLSLTSGASLSITAGAAISLTSPILNLTSVAMINAGPKVVAPTGVGPFNAIPFCLFTSAPHSGMMAVG